MRLIMLQIILFASDHTTCIYYTNASAYTIHYIYHTIISNHTTCRTNVQRGTLQHHLFITCLNSITPQKHCIPVLCNISVYKLNFLEYLLITFAFAVSKCPKNSVLKLFRKQIDLLVVTYSNTYSINA